MRYIGNARKHLRDFHCGKIFGRITLPPSLTMSSKTPHSLPAAWLALLNTPTPADLGPGPRPGVTPLTALNRQIDDTLTASVIPARSGELLRSLILLWHDHADASHAICQEIETPDGSYVHGILHRREPDYWNSKYWFRRVGHHASFPALAEQSVTYLKGLGQTTLANQLAPRGEWDAFAFVDACEAAAGGRGDVNVLREVQRLETAVLLGYFLDAGGVDRR